MDLFEHDDEVRRKGFEIIAGVDEAGRGPLAGPVVAAAVILPPQSRILGVNDSKQLTRKERERLFVEITTTALCIETAIVDAAEIDKINILNATKLAMHRAITALKLRAELILIDAVKLPSIKIQQISIIKGDAKSASIAAASIIAKVTRDRLMMDYHFKYPQYGFDRHQGYGTKKHIEQIKKYGPCPIHRMTFRKVGDQPLPFS